MFYLFERVLLKGTYNQDVLSALLTNTRLLMKPGGKHGSLTFRKGEASARLTGFTTTGFEEGKIGSRN